MADFLNFILQSIQAILIFLILFLLWSGFTALAIGMFINRKINRVLRQRKKLV